MARRSTRSSSTTRGVRVSRQEAAVQKELKASREERPRRRRKAETRTGTPDPEPKPRPRRTTRRRAASANATDERIIHLAISSRAAVILRATLGRMRYEDEPALDAIKKELEDQLGEMNL